MTTITDGTDGGGSCRMPAAFSGCVGYKPPFGRNPTHGHLVGPGLVEPEVAILGVGLGQRDKLGLAFNEMVRNGELKAPIVIGRDHLDSGSVASPNRETEAMKDGSDAVSDWALLNALLNTAPFH